MEKPKLRFIETFTVQHNGSEFICLRDPQDTYGNMLLVPPQALYIISHFTGKNSIVDIQSSIMKRYGNLIYKEQILELIKQLDDAFLLDSERYRNYHKRVEEDFQNSNVRESSHAGLSYPKDVNELSSWLDSYFENTLVPQDKNLENTIGIISPHIDFSRGGKSYAKAYKELLKNQECNTFIIFGTSHYTTVNNPFILTKKNFITPFGEVEIDIRSINKIEKACNWDLYEGEIFHKAEHSIEFQVVFLQYIFQGVRKIKIVPILCNSFYKFIENGTSPADDVNISIFLDTVKEIVLELGDKVSIIAGADLTHMGHKFGDREAVDENILDWIKRRDHMSIGLSEQLDAEGFYRTIEEEKDIRKICGLSPIYSLLKTVNAKKGKMLDYGQALEPDTGSVVTYTSIGFYS